MYAATSALWLSSRQRQLRKKTHSPRGTSVLHIGANGFAAEVEGRNPSRNVWAAHPGCKIREPSSKRNSRKCSLTPVAAGTYLCDSELFVAS